MRDYLETLLQEFRNTTEIDTTLLSQIENYIQKVEVSPKCNIRLNVKFGNENMFFIINNTAWQIEGLTLTIEHGVSLCHIRYSNEEKKRIRDSGLRFNDFGYNLFYLNFYYDAYSLCTTLQYLAQYYGYSPEDITINLVENDISEEIKNDETVDSSVKVGVWGAIILLFAAAIFLFWTWIEFGDAQFIIIAILSAASAIWCIIKLISKPLN